MTQSWPPPESPYSNQPTPPHPLFPVHRCSAWAIASLVCGILGCIPVITSLLATIFGIVGIRQTSRPHISGRGMAIAGLVLGLLGILGWAVLIGGAAMLYRGSAQPRALARQFAQDLASGNVDAAMKQTSGGITREQLSEASKTLQDAGTLSSVSIRGVHWNNSNGVTDWELKGFVVFGNGDTKPYFTRIRRQGEIFKIVKFALE